MPNITGNIYFLRHGTISDSNVSNQGALNFEWSEKTGISINGNITQETIGGIILNASNSNAIYGTSTTVQPPALQLIPQIRY